MIKKIIIIFLPIILMLITPLYSEDLKELEEIIDTILKDKEADLYQATPGTTSIKSLRIAESGLELSTSAKSPSSALLETGIKLFNASLYKKAKRNFEKLRNTSEEQYKDIASIWIARIEMKSNRIDEAINELNKIDKESGEYPTALYSLGEATVKKGRLKDAIPYFFKIYSLFPGHELADDALMTLGNIYLNLQKGSQALDAALRVIKQYSSRENVDDAYYLLGKIFERDRMQRDFSIARKIYRKFLQKASDGASHFKNSPLIDRVKRDLSNLEAEYFGLEG